jgi:hypothetical protein
MDVVAADQKMIVRPTGCHYRSRPNETPQPLHPYQCYRSHCLCGVVGDGDGVGMKKEHSPLPFALIGKQGTAIWSKDEIVGQMYEPRNRHSHARADAEFIVSACNSHYELIEALENCIAWCSCNEGTGSPCSTCRKAIKAIARAIGGAK